jgi:hypothetical protein
MGKVGVPKEIMVPHPQSQERERGTVIVRKQPHWKCSPVVPVTGI